jgi:hypothetical protein
MILDLLIIFSSFVHPRAERGRPNDFTLFAEDKRQLIETRAAIAAWLTERRKLVLNNSTNAHIGMHTSASTRRPRPA